jgi:hypothetical protein
VGASERGSVTAQRTSMLPTLLTLFTLKPSCATFHLLFSSNRWINDLWPKHVTARNARRRCLSNAPEGFCPVCEFRRALAAPPDTGSSRREEASF